MIIKEYSGSQRIHVLDSNSFRMQSFPTLMSQGSSGCDQPARLVHKSCVINGEEMTHWRREGTRSWGGLHSKCFFPAQGDFVSDKADHELLSVNKQLHMEESPILYSTQIFSFDNPDTLRRFLNTISRIQRQALRKIDLSIEVTLQMKVGGPSEMLGLLSDWKWPEEELLALERITDLGLRISIREPKRSCFFPTDEAVPDSNHVADGYFQAFHKALRWQFGFLRRLKNLKNVAVDINDYHFQLHPDYPPIMAAEFEAEFISSSADDIIQAEAVEDGYREEQVRLIRALVYITQDRRSLARELEICEDEVIRLEHEVSLGNSQDALAEAKKQAEETQKLLSEAEAFDPEAVEKELELLKEKIATHDKSTFGYLDEFEKKRRQKAD